jgi:hypothetical protein
MFEMPASGFWGNPQEIGIALHLFTQNGVMFGTYYGYEQIGVPVWYLFTARFDRPGDSPGTLHARATLEEYGHGSCIGCPYQPPEQVGLPGFIELNFDQRNHGTYRVNGGGEPIHIVPLQANSPIVSEFADEMRYALPDPAGAWVLTFKAEAGDGASFERLASISGVFGAKNVWSPAADGRPGGMDWTFSAGAASADPPAVIVCEAVAGSPPAGILPQCGLLAVFSSTIFPEFAQEVWFPLPYANVTGGRMASKDPDTGIRFEAFRIGYD